VSPGLGALAEQVAAERPVFPLAPGGKVPLIPGGRGLLAATQEPEQVREWWAKEPAANIGAPVLRYEIVLDVDPDNGGEESAAKLDADVPGWRETRSHSTRSGGRHYFFVLPWDVEPEDLRGKLPGFPGVDVRKSGSYVVWPGSTVPHNGSAGRYEVADDREPSELPEALLGLLLREQPQSAAVPGVKIEADDLTPYGRSALEDECATVAATPEGDRDNALNRACFSIGQLVAGGHVPFEAAEEALTAAGLACGLTPREVAKVGAKITEGVDSGARGPDVPRLTVADLTPEPEEQPSANFTAGGKIPARGFVAEVVDLIGPYTEAPDGAIALAALASLSATIGWRCRLEWARSPEPVALMGLSRR
jgi:hypothetical protein